MMHPPCDCRHCGCGGRPPAREPDRPRPPRPKPCPKPCRPHTESVLLQKIVCHERHTVPCACVQLALGGATECGQPPYTLVMVQQSGGQTWWTPLESQCDGRLRVRVFIPVCAQARDACGQLLPLTGVMELETSLRPSCPLADCWRHALVIVPCVRLCRADCASDCLTFSASVEVCLDLYLLRPEPYAMRRAERDCPDLPLYPPPIMPPLCSAQCPTAPAPCGWPRQG